ncbi:MAG: glutathione S-transferase [Sneathiella sp.]|uniref:glutathione S-transferase n=1 Tax=Sneathiella sp. TaxID=1964365 RepID=UPI000C36DC9F|nr:glutathione S-transferase [Sneathiella sp.]MAZ03818.1 glutathione S-transferase [Sneathiella sp.]
MFEPSKYPEESPLPVLYSFRRCPYAIRARMAIVSSGITVELRDILLKDKPRDMVEASPKATVPVLKRPDGKVIDESLDIMLWALEHGDPEGWLPNDSSLEKDIFSLIAENDGPFKSSLDRYKYHVRFPEKSREEYRKSGEMFLETLEQRLHTQPYLVTDRLTLADMAIFPFIRQFANSDIGWFEEAPYPNLRRWLDERLMSRQFRNVMKKREIWKEGTTGMPFPEADGS